MPKVGHFSSVYVGKQDEHFNPGNNYLRCRGREGFASRIQKAIPSFIEQ